MTKYTKKNYYAVVRSHIAPVICALWGITQALVSGYSNNKCYGFPILDEAISFMKDYPNYKFFRGSAEGERAPGKDELVYYAVANGEYPGVYEFYQGGAQEEITRYSHSCYKAFRSRKDAEDFIEEYRITADLVKRESQDGDIGTTLDEMMNQLRLE